MQSESLDEVRLHNGNIDNPKLTISVGPSVWFSSAGIKYGSAVSATNTNFSHYTQEHGNEDQAGKCALRIKDKIVFTFTLMFIVPKTVVKGMKIELNSSVREC